MATRQSKRIRSEEPTPVDLTPPAGKKFKAEDDLLGDPLDSALAPSQVDDGITLIFDGPLDNFAPPSAESTMPVLTREASRYLVPPYSSEVADVQCHLADPDDMDCKAILLELLNRRVLTRPKKTSKKPVVYDADGQPVKRTRKRIEKILPPWMRKDATLSDMVDILQLEVDTDEVYIDTTAEPAPFDMCTLAVIRQIAKKAVEFPSICAKWNTISIAYADANQDAARVYIPMNGRHATRVHGAAMTRAFEAMDAIEQLVGFQDITTNVLKDLGYGSKKATLYRLAWINSRHAAGPTSSSDSDGEASDSGSEAGIQVEEAVNVTGKDCVLL